MEIKRKRGRPMGSKNNTTIDQPPLSWFYCTCGYEIKALACAELWCRCGKSMSKAKVKK
jgi:hypothetical protein